MIRAIIRNNIKRQMKKEMKKNKISSNQLKREVIEHSDNKRKGYHFKPTLNNMACLLFGEVTLMN